MIDVLDSHYAYVKGRVATINPSRKFLGMMLAQDWPPDTVDMEAFYLLDLAVNPVERDAYSAADPIYIYTVQWTWLIAGTDLQDGLKGRNRGNRIRTSYQMKNELRQALYPNFCEKVQVSINASGTVIKTSYDPKEYIMWTPSSFKDRPDKESGLIYGTCTTQITGISAEIAA